MLDTFLKVRYLTFKTFNQPLGNLTKETPLLQHGSRNLVSGFSNSSCGSKSMILLANSGGGEYLVVAQIGYAGQYVRIIDVM